MSTPGYSGTPQLRKLGIGPTTELGVVNRPVGWDSAEPLQPGVHPGDGAADVLLAFVSEPEGFDDLPVWSQRIFPSGAIWIAWPRKA